jgi:hypothetical protein
MAAKFLERVEKDKSGKLQTPLDFLLRVMCQEDLSLEMRFEAAKAAAPFVHPKLQSVSVQSEEDNKLTIVLRDFGSASPAIQAGDVVTAQLGPSLADRVAVAVAGEDDDDTEQNENGDS